MPKDRKTEDFYPDALQAPGYTGPKTISICKRCKCIQDYCKVPAFHKSWAWLEVKIAETFCSNPNTPEYTGQVVAIGPYEKWSRSHAGLIRYEKGDWVSFVAVKNLAAFKFPQRPG